MKRSANRPPVARPVAGRQFLVGGPPVPGAVHGPGRSARAVELAVAGLMVAGLASVGPAAGRATAAAPASVPQPDIHVEVFLDETVARIPETLYGVFYEDINYAADGGLYAELVQNRSFEYFLPELLPRNRRSNPLGPLVAWLPVGGAELSVLDQTPLHPNNPHYLRVVAPAGGGVANLGFDGVPVQRGKRYDVAAFARGDAPLEVSLRRPDGSLLASASLGGPSRQWRRRSAVLRPAATAHDARLVVKLARAGAVELDMVSLFPRQTYKGRKNGMRKDLAEAIAALAPKVFRFPGGCIVHGHGLANRYHWKDSVGPVEHRKPNWNCWGYHQSYGLGYYEYFQFCEDIGAEPLPVVPVGVSCGARKPYECTPMEGLPELIADARDLIEFANGGADTRWGAVRVAMGRRDPFGMEYLCLGNEEHDTPEFRERFPAFVEALRESNPEIKLVGTSGLTPAIPLYRMMGRLGVDVSDEHYYRPPDWFIRNSNRFDEFDRNMPKVFVGEYASRGNKQYNAVAEAMFLTGVERNSDHVVMTAYAPLLARRGSTQWRPDLIYFDHTRVVLTPNYHVQRLFSRNRGDRFVRNTVRPARPGLGDPRPVRGSVGVGTWKTSAVFDDLRVTSAEGRTSYSESFSTPGGWVFAGGDYRVSAGALWQRDADAVTSAFVDRAVCSDRMTLTLRAKKVAGSEGFFVRLGRRGEGDMLNWNLGGYGNTRSTLEEIVAGEQRILENKPRRVEADRWYDLRVAVDGPRVRCWLDDVLVHDVDRRRPVLGVSSTIDDASGGVVLKVVNPLDVALCVQLALRGGGSVGATATRTTLAAGAEQTNTFEYPDRVTPVTDTVPAGRVFICELAPTSLQVLRIAD